jgi:hypothetical protein
MLTEHATAAFALRNRNTAALSDPWVSPDSIQRSSVLPRPATTSPSSTKRSGMMRDCTLSVDDVSKLLTTEAMISMNKAVAIDKQGEAEVAKKLLEANNLL